MSAYHLNGNSVILGENSNGKVHPSRKFSKKKGISSRFYRNSRKFLYHSSTLTSARLLIVILPRKNAKDLKDGSHLGEEDCVPKERLRRRLERWR